MSLYSLPGLCIIFLGLALYYLFGTLYSLLGLCIVCRGFPLPGPTAAAAVAQGGAGTPSPRSLGGLGGELSAAGLLPATTAPTRGHPMPPLRPLCARPQHGVGVGGVISIFILISIWILLFISLWIWIDPKPDLQRPAGFFIYMFWHAFLTKARFVNIQRLLSMFLWYWSIIVNICENTVLHTYLPTIRYCMYMYI